MLGVADAGWVVLVAGAAVIFVTDGIAGKAGSWMAARTARAAFNAVAASGLGEALYAVIAACKAARPVFSFCTVVGFAVGFAS